MKDSQTSFASTASSLARNPLGIIALFIVLVYGFASLVTAFAGSLTLYERLPLIYFLVGFPILVLGVFSWLVSKHSGKLFAPADFKNEDNYVRMQMTAVASLAAASTKDSSPSTEVDLEKIVDAVRSASTTSTHGHSWRNHILWVDDRPENNAYERQAFEALGLRFTLTLSTDEALQRISHSKFAAIISDMERREGPREGYVLLERLRQMGDQTPLFFYASTSKPEHRREAQERGGQGCTNNPQELFEMVTRAVIIRSVL